MAGTGQAPLIFLWENIGPTHADRLAAAAAAFPDRRVVALQYAARSHTYAWDGAGEGADGAGWTLRTLFPTGRPRGWRLAWRLARALLAERGAACFLCHYQEWPVWLAAIAARLAGRRVVAMMESKFDDYPRHLPREAGKLLLFLPYQRALAGTERTRDYLRFLGIGPARVALGYATLSLDRIRRLAAAPPAPGGTAFAERDFVAVARLVPKKNLVLALEAYALWRAATGGGRDLHLLGDGPLEGSLRARAAALGIAAHVHFHGFVQTDAVCRRLARALCLLLPSTEEQFGLVAIEAHAMGVPVLLSVNAGAADRLVAPGRSGFLLTPHDPAAWAATMALVSEDEGRWAALAAGAVVQAEGLDARRFATGVAQALA